MRDGEDIPDATSSTYMANDGGEHSYNVRVRADLCEHGTTDNASTIISWTDKPSFDGIQSATSAQDPICTMNLDWNDAESLCPGPVTYTIYRDTESPVYPTQESRIAFGLTDTTYVDMDGLENRGVYHYLVQAIEGSTGEAGTTFPRLRRVSCYATAINLLEKSPEERRVSYTNRSLRKSKCCYCTCSE